MKRHKKHEEPEDEAWLMTYADMVTLLLCFFIIMFALSSPDSQKVATIAQALQKFETGSAAPVETPDEQNLKKQIDMSLSQSGYDQFIAVSKNERFISMDLAADSFFVPGSAELTPKGVEVLAVPTQQIMTLANKPVLIEIEGHTDDSPISTAKFPSNWELSSARAATVARYLISQGFPKEKIRIIGYAETRPKAPNYDTEGKAIPSNRDLNRRVIIKLLKKDEESH